MKPIIALVEDNEDNREVMAVMLEPWYQVRCYNDGLSGLNGIRQNHPDAVLLDIGLPVMDGITVAQALRSDPALQTLPIIAVTAHASQSDLDKFAKCFDDYLTKPIINFSVLRDVIQKHLNKNAKARAAADRAF